MSDLTKKWTKEVSDFLINRKIVEVRYLTNEEAEDMGWYSRPVALLLDNGVWLYPSADDEGNDGGALFTSDEKMSVIPVLSVENENA
jgi:hypothetical protein